MAGTPEAGRGGWRATRRPSRSAPPRVRTWTAAFLLSAATVRAAGQGVEDAAGKLFAFEQDATILIEAQQCGVNARQIGLLYAARVIQVLDGAPSGTEATLNAALGRARERAASYPAARVDPACQAVVEAIAGLAVRARINGEELRAAAGRK